MILFCPITFVHKFGFISFYIFFLRTRKTSNVTMRRIGTNDAI